MSRQPNTSTDYQAQSPKKAQRAEFDEQQAIIKMLFDHAPLMMGVAELDGDTIIGVNGNAAVAQLLDLSPDDIPHRTGEELGNSPEENQIWLEHYQRSQQEDRQVKFEYKRPNRSSKQWLSVTVNYLGTSSQNRPRFSFFAEDITERKQAEMILRMNEERQAYLLKLSDALRPLSDAVEIQETATQTAIEYFKTNRSYYCEIDGDVVTIRRDACSQPDLPSVSGVYSLSEMPIFKGVSQTGRPIVVPDVNTTNTVDEDLRQLCLQMQIISYINVPVIKDGQLVGNFCLTQSTPREWTASEVALVEETAERAWAAVERARTEAELRQSEGRFRALAETAPLGVGVSSADGKILYTNQAFEKILGYQPGELIGLPSIVIYHAPPDRQVWQSLMAEKGKISDYEIQFKRKDGSLLWASINVAPIEFAGRVGIIAVWQDVTERRRAEEELKESEEKYRSLFENLNSAGLLIEPILDEAGRLVDFRYLMANPAVEKHIRKTPDEMVGKCYSEVFSYPGRNPVFDIYEQVLFTGEPYKGEVLLPALNRHYDMAIYRPVPGRLALLLSDITERKQAEEALRESEAFLRRSEVILRESEASLSRSNKKISDILSSITDTFYVLDREWRFVYVNKQCTGRLGQEPEDWIGKNFWEMFPKHLQSPFYENFHASMERGETRRFEIDGRYTESWYNFTCFPSPEGIAVLGQDITDRKQAEEALRQSEERFRTSIENLAEAFVIYSAVRRNGEIVDLRYEYVNDQACAFHHLSREQLVGHTILEVIPAVKETGLFDQYAQVVKTGEPLSGQRYVPNHTEDKSRAQGVFDFRVSKFGDGMIITANDVTERVRLEAEHQETIKEREIHHRLTEQREMERQSIARDIHDGPVQTLSSLLFNLQMLKEVYPDPTLQLEVDNVKLSIKATVQELRQVMYELRPPSVIQFGISKAIQSYTENLREHHVSITWHLDLADDDSLLSQQTCLTLFRIYQEAVNNIIRHSEAKQTWVRIEVFPDQIVLEIRDDGKGFVRSQDMAHLTDRKHFGLAGIAERVEAIHGELEIKTQPGDGTTITVKVPIKRE